MGEHWERSLSSWGKEEFQVTNPVFLPRLSVKVKLGINTTMGQGHDYYFIIKRILTLAAWSPFAALLFRSEMEWRRSPSSWLGDLDLFDLDRRSVLKRDSRESPFSWLSDLDLFDLDLRSVLRRDSWESFLDSLIDLDRLFDSDFRVALCWPFDLDLLLDLDDELADGERCFGGSVLRSLSRLSTVTMRRSVSLGRVDSFVSGLFMRTSGELLSLKSRIQISYS